MFFVVTNSKTFMKSEHSATYSELCYDPSTQMGNSWHVTWKTTAIFIRVDSIYNELSRDHVILLDIVKVRKWVKKRNLKRCTWSHIGYHFKIFI